MKKKPPRVQYGTVYRYGSSERAIKDLTRVEKKQREAKKLCAGCGHRMHAGLCGVKYPHACFCQREDNK